MSNFKYSSNSPQLVWVIEPETKIRFRYESEGGSHGGLAGKAGKKTYPTLRLLNYDGRRKIYVRVSLYTEDKKPHVLEFKGKKNEGSKPDIKEFLEEDTNTVAFKNIHILSKKKDAIEKELMERKLNNLKDELSSAARASFEKMYTKDVKERARAILNSIRLYFEAFEVGRPDVRLCDLYSDVICNQKAASKGDLRICRLSCVTGSCKGGDEIILLCEKVQKDNIKIKFFETDETGQIIWYDYACFSPLDVHYQVAIPFKTPPYRNNEEKIVYICLERNEEVSDPREFTYKPDETSSKKRKLEECETVLFPDTPDSTSACPPYLASPDIPNGASGGFLSFPSDDFQESDMNDEQSLNLEDFLHGDIDLKDFDLPFEDLVPFGNLDDGSDGFFIPVSKVEIGQPEIDGQIYGQMDSVDGHQMSEMIAKQREDLIDINLRVKNIKLNDSDEHTSNVANNSLQRDSTISKAYLTSISSSVFDLQRKRIMYSSLLLKRDLYGNTILHRAVLSNKNIVPLLKMGYFVKIDLTSLKNHKNQTALHNAIEENKWHTVRILLKCHSNPNLKDCKGNNCYLVAAFNNFPAVLCEIDRFSQFHHQVSDFNDEGLTALHVAVMQKNPAVFVILAMHMADPNIAEKKAGKSLLHYAVEFPSFILEKLLQMPNINVNIQDFEGNTPLHIACASANIEIVKKLLKCKADPSIKNFKQNELEESSEDENSNGQLPADLTTNLEILKLLRSATREVIEGLIDVQDPNSFQESYEMPCQITEELSKYLDEDNKWEKLVPFFLDEDVMESLSLGSSPSKALLAFVKKEEQDNYLARVKTALEFAGLTDGIYIINQHQTL